MTWDGEERRGGMFDPVAFGRLLESVERLTGAVETLEGEVKELRTDRDKGKGVLTGLMLAAGLVGGVLAEAINWWMGR